MGDMKNNFDMKLVKFRYSVTNAAQHLLGWDNYYMPFNLPLGNYDKYYKNSFLAVVFDTVFLKPTIGGKSGPLIDEWDKALKLLEEDSIKLYTSNSMTWIYTFYWKSSMIFWALVMTAIDDDFYNNEINMISDLAYLLGYTEDMMSDWVEAVKYLLDGNMFSSDMPLEFKTAEANKFFKHK